MSAVLSGCTVMATFSYIFTVMIIFIFFGITFKILNEAMISESQCTTACSFSN